MYARRQRLLRFALACWTERPQTVAGSVSRVPTALQRRAATHDPAKGKGVRKTLSRAVGHERRPPAHAGAPWPGLGV